MDAENEINQNQLCKNGLVQSTSRWWFILDSRVYACSGLMFIFWLLAIQNDATIHWLFICNFFSAVFFLLPISMCEKELVHSLPCRRRLRIFLHFRQRFVLHFIWFGDFSMCQYFICVAKHTFSVHRREEEKDWRMTKKSSLHFIALCVFLLWHVILAFVHTQFLPSVTSVLFRCSRAYFDAMHAFIFRCEISFKNHMTEQYKLLLFARCCMNGCHIAGESPAPKINVNSIRSLPLSFCIVLFNSHS